MSKQSIEGATSNIPGEGKREQDRKREEADRKSRAKEHLSGANNVKVGVLPNAASAPAGTGPPGNMSPAVAAGHPPGYASVGGNDV